MATARRESPSGIAGALRSPSLPVALIIAAVLTGMAALWPIVQSSGATNTAGTIRQLERERSDWRARVRALELEVAAQGSLNRIEQEATQRLKMGPPEEVHYIAVDAAAPEPRRLPSRYLPEPPQQADAGRSLWEELFGWIPRP